MVTPRKPDATLVIEKGVPLPGPLVKSHKRYPWRKMEPGDSFFVPNGSLPSVAGNAKETGKILGRVFICRREGNGVRVWRADGLMPNGNHLIWDK